MKRLLLFKLVILWMCFRLDDAVIFNNHPGPLSLNENDDTGQALWSVSATCNPSVNQFNGTGTLIGTTPLTVGCTCELNSNPDSGLFYWSSDTVYKYGCSDTSCGTCPSCTACDTSDGCLTGPTTYSLVIRCYTSGYDYDDDGTETLTVAVTEETPTLSISLPASVSADNSMSINHVLATTTKSSGPAILDYVKSSAVANTYLLNTANMFELNTANGEIYVATDPSVEYDFTYSMGVCIHSRRQSSCDSITINFDGCFQTPNCDDQTDNSLSDQHAIGGILFTMTYDDPSDHFETISPTWQNLRFEMVSSTLNETTLDPVTGIITTTGNITVWPDYPYSNHTIVIRVSNSGHSCSYTDTCTMSMQFAFTNYPIRFVSLPNSATVHEDTDSRTHKHSVITFDGNSPEQDNVTCTEVANDEPGLLELYHNGNFSYDSWFIYKKSCLDAGCGYINESFLCSGSPADGCLNYDERTSYNITINCNDAYGNDTGDEVFTLNVLENQPPVFTNTPTTITLNTDLLADGDKVISIFYTDSESETLDYNFTVTPSTNLFEFDSRGNYYDNPANATATSFQWDLVNSSFVVDFCGRERRNIVCSNFTIDIRDNCGPTPVCVDEAVTVTDQFAPGDELFQIDVTGTGYTSLTYVIITQYPALFSVESVTGSVTSLADLPVTNPPNPSVYSIVGNVYDTAACEVAACSFSVTVNFTNFDISITNVDGISEDIHEDNTDSVTYLTIATSDDNTVDGVSCEVDEAESVPANTSIFFAVQTDIESNVFELMSIERPGFDYDTADTYHVVVKCEDDYGSSATATMTVNILENQEPTIDNLNTSDVVNVDPMSVSPGYVIFTLQTSDDENDPLDYSCTVDNSFNPLECLSDGVVSLRRPVRVPEEDGIVYNITLCVNDTVHNHSLCETLGVNFTSSKTNPVLNNLPANISFPEDTSLFTTLFTVTVDDPDISDVHTFTVTVYPDSATSLFFLDANSGTLTLEGSLDYETLNSYEFLFSVTDQYLPGLEGKYLSLDITDVNEGPTLTLDQTSFNTIEQATGYEVATLIYTCTDVDAGQTMNVTISSGTYAHYFSFDQLTGNVSYAQDWDFEAAGTLPQITSLEITCDDGNGSSDSANIVINISPTNEFAPLLSLNEVNVTIYENQTLLDPLFVVTATDNDFGDDGLFEFSVLGAGKGSRYFRMSTSGELLLQNYIRWNYNYTWEFTVKVSDGESEPLMSYIHVIVTYIAPDPVIPTKEKARCILCTNTGKGVVAALCVEAFILLAAFIHCTFRMKMYQVCQLKPKPRVQTLADLNKILEEKKKADDPYMHDPETLRGALPKHKPPESFRYDTPVRRRTLEPPDAAAYLPPGAVINLQHLPEHARAERRLQVTAEVYPEDIVPRSEEGDGLYHFTEQDRSTEYQEARTPVSPMFKTPAKVSLYDYDSLSKPPEDIDDVIEDSLDF